MGMELIAEIRRELMDQLSGERNGRIRKSGRKSMTW